MQPWHSSISRNGHSLSSPVPHVLKLRAVGVRTHHWKTPVGSSHSIWRNAMWLLWEILIGIVVGFLAGQIVKGHGMGVLVDLIVGIIGSLLGGWIFGLLGLAAYGLIGQLVMGVVGAVVLLLLVRLIKRA